MGVSSYHIERPDEIEDAWLANASVVGVTAGASTPDDVIQEVVDVLVAHGYAPPEGGIRPVDPDARARVLGPRRTNHLAKHPGKLLAISAVRWHAIREKLEQTGEFAAVEAAQML